AVPGAVDLRAADVQVGAVAPETIADDCWTTELLQPAGHVERMQPEDKMHVTGDNLLGLGRQVKRVRGRVNDRRAGDADFGRDVVAADVGGGNRGHTRPGFEEIVLP